MSYPPAGGDPNAPGQQPNPEWWDQPAQQAGQQPVDQASQETKLNWAAQPGGLPQDQGYGAPSGYAQSGGYPQATGPGMQPGQAPGFAPPVGYGQQPGYGQPGFPPPRKSNTGLIIGIVLGAVVLLAIAAGAIVLVAKKDDSAQVAATTTTAAQLTAPATTRKGAPTTSKAAPAGKRFSYTEYGKDWDYKFGGVALQAKYVSGRDYDTCAPIEDAGKLTGLGCKYASEMAWKSENGGLMLTQLVLTMADVDKAASAVDSFDDQDLVLPDGSYIADFEVGKWMNGEQGTFLVVTEVTTTAAVDEPTAEKYLENRHNDTVGALGFR
ncbi:hypothetical protein D7D52_35755 [Nocardia yunnanensis]|uniref:Uncharacterized protein n=1 Tax=Nocardia yunnanensis TaxID=2382165 RepID=A0A386ZNN2_9NOCA|nr:hypothetical protein [Nocardia yunnanensis]AYF78299.1 hypothetical protein D7D52_35755 [Nocardia yunnanensis]